MVGIKALIAAIAGIVLGIIASRFLLVGSGLSLVPWSIAGLLIGFWCLLYRRAILLGAIYGFCLAFTFMITGYQGADPVFSKLPFFALLGIVGAICGIGLAWFGCFFRRRFNPAS